MRVTETERQWDIRSRITTVSRTRTMTARERSTFPFLDEPLDESLDKAELLSCENMSMDLWHRRMDLPSLAASEFRW